MLPDNLASRSESLPPTSARVSLAPRSGITSSVRFAAMTDPGRKRQLNEDNYLVDRSLSLYVVCDGMGGHAAGDVASATAVRAFREAVQRQEAMVRSYVGIGNRSVGSSKREVAQMLQEAANSASSVVHGEAKCDSSKRGMGTTLVAALVIGNHAFIVHVGDSRAYLLRGGRAEQLTRDHNVENDLVRRKKLCAEAARSVAPKNAITRAVGVYEHCEADTLVVDVAAGDRLLLCTDGLSGYFEGSSGEVELAGLLSGAAEQDVVQALVDAANRRGGKDNITAVVVTLGRVGEHDPVELARLGSSRRALSESRIFQLLDEHELLLVLEVTEVVQFSTGQVVIHEGERGAEMYIVLVGAVDVFRGDSRVARLGPGEHFGEMALIRNRTRSARALAAEPTELLVIPSDLIYQLLQTEQELGMKLLWRLTAVLADRLARTTLDLSVSREAEASEDLTDAVFYDEEEDDEDSRPTLPPPAPTAGAGLGSMAPARSEMPTWPGGAPRPAASDEEDIRALCRTDPAARAREPGLLQGSESVSGAGQVPPRGGWSSS